MSSSHWLVSFLQSIQLVNILLWSFSLFSSSWFKSLIVAFWSQNCLSAFSTSFKHSGLHKSLDKTTQSSFFLCSLQYLYTILSLLFFAFLLVLINLPQLSHFSIILSNLSSSFFASALNLEYSFLNSFLHSLQSCLSRPISFQ
jgi:hypothetical protein